MDEFASSSAAAGTLSLGRMRFRLLRSRSFWFGVPGLLFLLWAWWVSIGNISTMTIGGHGFKMPRRWEIGQAAGEVYATWGLGGWPDWKFYPYHGEMQVEARRHWRRNLTWVRAGDPAFRYLIVGHHWLVLGYLVAWSGPVFWRSRRYRALAEWG